MASGINLHMVGKITRYYQETNDEDYSIGCITVPVRFYRDFGVNVGFIKDLEQNRNTGKKDNNYGNAKSELRYDDGNAVEDFEGYMVINRDYYEDSEGYLKFNGPNKEKGEEKK